MAALDFPSSPSNGQTYAGPGGAVWQYDGAKWVNGASASAVVSSFNTRTGAVTLSSGDVTTALTYTPYNATNPSGYQTAANVTTALVPYATLAAPVFTGDARAVTPAAGDADTSVATTAFVQTAVAPAFNGVGRNLCHNPLFNVAQRGAGPFTGSAMTMDRWATIVTTDTISVTQAALTAPDRAGIGDESATVCFQNTFTGNAAAGSFHLIIQRTEDVRRLTGKTVTVSFYAAASATLKLGINILQSPGTGGSASGGGRFATGTQVTLGTTWARYTATFALPSLTTMTMGTNGDSYTGLEFWFSSGATNNAIAGNVGVQAGTVKLWGVQLEVGSGASPLEKPDIRYDGANCERFFKILTGIRNYQYAPGAATGLSAGFALGVAMRATPTMTFSNISYVNASTLASIAITPQWVGWQWQSAGAGAGTPIFDMALSADL